MNFDTSIPIGYNSFMSERVFHYTDMQSAEMYKRVSGSLVDTWGIINDATQKPLYKQDGIGTCKNSAVFDKYVFLPILKKEQLQVPHTPKKNACAFLGENGCTLGPLRGPQCLAVVDPGHEREIAEKFGMSFSSDMILKILGDVQSTQSYTDLDETTEATLTHLSVVRKEIEGILDQMK